MLNTRLDVISQTDLQEPVEPATNEVSMDQLHESDTCSDL